VHLARCGRLPPLDHALGHGIETAARQGIRRRTAIAGLATIGSGICGCGMTPRFGAHLNGDATTFRLWAPAAQRVEVVLDGAHPMQQAAEGWHELTLSDVRAGALYKYRLEDGTEVPDPASHFQPHDVFGPSEVIDHDAFVWHAGRWRGRPWHEAV